MNISGNNLLFLGLFCDKTQNFNVYLYFEKKYARKDEKLKKMYCSEATLITIRYIHYNLEPFYMEIVAEYSYGEPDYEILEYYSPTKKFGLQPD